MVLAYRQAQKTAHFFAGNLRTRKDAKKTGNEQSDSDLSEEDYDLQKLSDKERQAFDEEFSMQEEEKKVNHNEEILALHDKGYSILEISKMLEMGQGEVKFVLDMYE